MRARARGLFTAPDSAFALVNPRGDVGLAGEEGSSFANSGEELGISARFEGDDAQQGNSFGGIDHRLSFLFL
jgi:hypothetical protein